MNRRRIVIVLCAVALPCLILLQVNAALLGDIDNDGKIGLEESVYSLQVASGVNGEYQVSIVFKWRGNWETNTSYGIGDVVYLDGTSYICTSDNLSDASNLPPHPEFWNILARKGETGDLPSFLIGPGLQNENDTLSVNVGTGLSITGNAIGLDAGHADGSAYDGRFVTRMDDAMRLPSRDQTPCPCDTSHAGTIYLTPIWRLCVCNGSKWVEVNDGVTPCTALDIDNDGDGFAESEGDCDDSDRFVSPGATEGECPDERDNDCDGLIDEDIPLVLCRDGDCIGVAHCENGMVICAYDPNIGAPCGDGGTYVCDPAGGISCEEPPEEPELCDSIDNDSDGQTDEGFNLGQPCGVGACSGGHTVCNAAGDGGVCSTDNLKSSEVCDGIDNDCDGATDEDIVCE